MKYKSLSNGLSTKFMQKNKNPTFPATLVEGASFFQCKFSAHLSGTQQLKLLGLIPIPATNL